MTPAQFPKLNFQKNPPSWIQSFKLDVLCVSKWGSPQMSQIGVQISEKIFDRPVWLLEYLVWAIWKQEEHRPRLKHRLILLRVDFDRTVVIEFDPRHRIHLQIHLTRWRYLLDRMARFWVFSLKIKVRIWSENGIFDKPWGSSGVGWILSPGLFFLMRGRDEKNRWPPIPPIPDKLFPVTVLLNSDGLKAFVFWKYRLNGCFSRIYTGLNSEKFSILFFAVKNHEKYK